MYFPHNHRVHEYGRAALLDVVIVRQLMSMVHHHFGHTFVHAALRIIPEANIHGTAVRQISLEQIITLLNILTLVVFSVSANQVETKQSFRLSRVLLAETAISHLELNFVPQSVFVIGGQSLFRRFELTRKGSHVDVIVVTVSAATVQVVKLACDLLINRSVDF